MSELLAALGLVFAVFLLGTWYGQMLPRGSRRPSPCFKYRADNARVIDEVLNRGAA
jgi:hypothetical protein